ncbi:hypothetical protein O6H91_01G128700 [Diphasiastrum complanatum]|uniref:Uncharacterized protein n=2 Tax=Diphasiastrum complanatum TaxID=34168 RepID=A0ACC2EW29_DIPCM|nr:hypothetical protein O6H91_01G128700 [Diphasiastrum complanatum]KAJ7570622.1 hypothetical protein O6H91_01G128700 [Diphasiastrum complanatum]
MPHSHFVGNRRRGRGFVAMEARASRFFLLCLSCCYCMIPSLLAAWALSEEAENQGQCLEIADQISATKFNPYEKVTNPSLAPRHLEDLPGFTRSVYERDHALITPESQVFNPLPGWVNTEGAYLITPAMGAHFVMYIAKMGENSSSGLPQNEVERFIFLVEGEVELSTFSRYRHHLLVDSYTYLPPNIDHKITAASSSTIIIFERRYLKERNEAPELIIGNTEEQPILETSGEVFALRKLLPTSPTYDFNIHVMDFQPGEYLNVKELHYFQHGLVLLEGRGIYRLGEKWYPVQAGDAIWMAPFVTQWYAALGQSKSRYLLYKDVNRDPLLHPF